MDMFNWQLERRIRSWSCQWGHWWLSGNNITTDSLLLWHMREWQGNSIRHYYVLIKCIHWGHKWNIISKIAVISDWFLFWGLPGFPQCHTDSVTLRLPFFMFKTQNTRSTLSMKSSQDMPSLFPSHTSV